MTAWSDAEEANLKQLWDVHKGRLTKISRAMGRSRGSISSKSRKLGLQFAGGRALVLSPGHPALTEKRTIYPHKVLDPDDHVLKSGDNQRKLGAMVTKGKWKGFPIFSLTLEERATCPQTCVMWRGCYGNNSNHSKRYRHGAALEEQIISELASFEVKYPLGFVVRLHQLGDFYSVRYVEFWALMLQMFPGLHVFGYTAWLSGSAIGNAVSKLRNSQWDRFAVRTSGAGKGIRSVVFHAKAPPGVIPCPAQEGKTSNCGTCGLCWHTQRPIGFKAH